MSFAILSNLKIKKYEMNVIHKYEAGSRHAGCYDITWFGWQRLLFVQIKVYSYLIPKSHIIDIYENIANAKNVEFVFGRH